jgi:hypothetical protein
MLLHERAGIVTPVLIVAATKAGNEPAACGAASKAVAAPDAYAKNRRRLHGGGRVARTTSGPRPRRTVRPECRQTLQHGAASHASQPRLRCSLPRRKAMAMPETASTHDGGSGSWLEAAPPSTAPASGLGRTFEPCPQGWLLASLEQGLSGTPRVVGEPRHGSAQRVTGTRAGALAAT